MSDTTPNAHSLDGTLPAQIELLTKLLETTNDLVWCTTADGRELLYVNSAAERIYGRSLADFAGNLDLWFETIHPEDRDSVRNNLRQLLERRQIEQEYRIVRPDGGIRWLRDRVAVIYDESGNAIQIGGIATDVSREQEAGKELSLSNQKLQREVSERKLAEDALRDSEALYHSLVDNLPIYVTRIDLDGRITYVNNNYCQLVGLPAEQILGKTNYDFHPPEYAKKYTEDEMRVAQTGEVFTDIEENQIGEESRYFEVRKAPVFDDQQRVIEIQAVFWDVTERHHAEIKRQQAEDALRGAQDAAEAASRAKSDFLANMIHEIRTPMNAIIGMTELLLDTNLDRSQRDYVRIVHDSGDSLLTLINDILDFSKIEAGKFTLDAVRFSLEDSLGDTMKALAIRAHRKNLELALHVAPDVPDRLMGDPGRLRQVIINLVGNGIKFTQSGEVVLDVECESRSEKQATLRFSVSDTGIGIPEDKLTHVFDAFEQVDTSTTRQFGGTGLGLAITTRIVELMGGHVSVTSSLGEGSVFSFTVQFDLAQNGVRRFQLPKPEQLTGMRVLIVDDNSTNQRILEEMLSVHQMQPVAVGSAQEALDLITRAHKSGEDYPLILTDVNMPDVDGFTLVEQIRQTDQLKQPVVIVLTSGDRRGDQARCEELGVAAHLLKPIKQSELFDAVVLAFGIAAPDTHDSDIPATDEPRTVPSLRILLAEDAYANQMLAVGLLKKWNHTVLVAENGAQAVELLEKEPFDLVLMDVQMPEMDGFEATKRIRQLEAEKALPHLTRHPIPIVAMTAHAMKGDRERCLASGMDGYVSKPIRVSELQSAIAQFFGDDAPVSTTEKTPTHSGGTAGMCADDVDWTAALQSVNGDVGLLKVVAAAFLEECPGHRDHLAQALANCDSAALHRVAHLIKGICMTLGATRAGELAQQLETMSREGELDAADECLVELDRSLDHVVNILGRLVNGEIDPT